MARVGGWAVDLATEEVFWSDEMYEILEYPADRTPDLETALDMCPAPHRDRVTQALEACRTEGAPFDLELAARTAGGRELWVRAVGEAERDASGTIVRVQGAFQDISDRKAAEDQARWLTEQLTATLESMTDAFYTVDPGWCITYVNTSFERLIQQDRAEMVGRVLWDVFPEAVGSPFEAAHRRAADEGAPTVVEAFYEPLDGWFEGRIYPTGQGLAVYVRDVSRRVEREQALQRVATAEQEAAERLRGLDRTKNAFLSALSHELRTPLTIVQGMSETLRHRRDDLDDASRTRLEDALVANVRRLGRLLEDLLDIDRLVRGRGSPEPGPVEAAALLRAGVAASPVGARAVVDAPDQLDTTADRVQVERILANLLDNAAKYAPDGVVHVRLRPLRAGGFRLEVEDQGPGIPAGELTAAFEPFHRLDDEHPQPGTGIGLALVREFAAGHGGRAWAERADSAGLRVVVEIPDPSDG
jgi:PAS domain S-box-containing protein